WMVDAIVTDVTMPRMDGLTLAARVHAEHKSMPIIFMTGNAALRDSPQSNALSGRVDWMLKPFSVEGLLIVLNRRLTRSGAPRA
ncbi:MAG: response regulator, partial [Gemmatimonadaceae bacterium]